MKRLEIVPAEAARALLLSTHVLGGEPLRVASTRSVADLIRKLGFVQIDTISVVERAHHHILGSRLARYRGELLAAVHQRGAIFEHVTHDASFIPTEWFPHWKHRFARAPSSNWFLTRLGEDPRRVVREVRARIRREGPLMARDFDDERSARGSWWNWKPAKAALEYLWRSGELTVARREGFQKVYDLTERVLPEASAVRRPSRREHVKWACETALQRLVVATAKEIAAFWRAVSITEVRGWLAEAQGRGEVVPVIRRSIAGEESRAFAIPTWKELLAEVNSITTRTQLLSPFDPVVRDRSRLRELFGFEYQFEAFVPRPKRKFGYYVLPMLQGDRFIGRVDAKLERQSSVLTVLGVWWEPSYRLSRARSRALEESVGGYAALCGARSWRIERGTSLGTVID